MEWIQPVFLWGLLGISIPVAIHLWNGRRGKVIAWAATAWLNTQESQSSRSLRFDQWLLLLVRILLLVLIVLFIVGLWWKGLDQVHSPRIVHLVVPDEQVEAEFRFELNQALENGEDVLWWAEGLPDYMSGEAPRMKFEADNAQQYLDLLPTTLDSLHLYTSKLKSNFASNTLWVPKLPTLHLASPSVQTAGNSAALKLVNGGFLTLDDQGLLLKSGSEMNIPQSSIAFEGAVPVHFVMEDQTRKAAIQAALTALQEVYGLTFTETELKDARVVFADSSKDATTGKLYFQTTAATSSESSEVVLLDNSVQMAWEEIVDKGLLPELIASPLINYLGVSGPSTFLSESHLKEKFVEIPKAKQALATNTSEIILVLIVLVFGVERFLSYRNNL
jgi:uncharacterized integral membrane protein